MFLPQGHPELQPLLRQPAGPSDPLFSSVCREDGTQQQQQHVSFMWNWLTMFCNSCEMDLVQSINSEFLQWHRYRDVSWMKFLAIYRLLQNRCIVILSLSWAKYRDSIVLRGTWWYPALVTEHDWMKHSAVKTPSTYNVPLISACSLICLILLSALFTLSFFNTQCCLYNFSSLVCAPTLHLKKRGSISSPQNQLRVTPHTYSVNDRQNFSS